MPISGYAAAGIGLQKNKFSIGINGVLAPRLKRNYSSPTKRYKGKFSDGMLSLEFGFQPTYND